MSDGLTTYNVTAQLNSTGQSDTSSVVNVTNITGTIAAGGSSSPATFTAPGIVKQTIWNVRDFGAKCDGGCSQNGTLANTGVVTDTAPSILLPVAGQTFTWVGTGAAVGSGISGITMASSGAAPVITTTGTHGLSTGQVVNLSGVVGALEMNATWSVTVLSANTFSVPYNAASLGTYVSGGVVTPQLILNGFVSIPVVSGGTLTFTAVTTQGGSIPITIPSGAGTSGAYYYGTDDTTAWNTAITAAESAPLLTTQLTTIVWSGTSMVSSEISISGAVSIQGQWMDYTNPNGTQASSSYPQRGSVLRAIGTFSSPLSNSVLKLGSSSSLLSGQVSSSLLFGVVDAANITYAAIKVVGQRNFALYAYGLNGTQRAWELVGGNTECIECIAGQSNTGDGVYCTASDSKWKGGYVRQACNGFHIASVGDLWIGNGVHIFNGYSGSHEQYGTDILVDGGGTSLSINGIILDGVLGPQIRLAPRSATTLGSVLIANISAFQPENTVNNYPLLQIDTTVSGSTVRGVTLDGYVIEGISSSKYKAIIDCLGAGTQTKIVLGAGTAQYCSTFYTTDGTAPIPQSRSGEIAIYNGSTTVYSSTRGEWAATADGTTKQYPEPHNLGQTPASVEFGPLTIGSVGVFVTVDASNIYFNFPTFPANNVSLGVWYRVAI